MSQFKTIKSSADVNRLLGEYTGTLEGICLWEIPEELKEKLKKKIKELKEMEIGLIREEAFKEYLDKTKPVKHNKK